MAVTLKQIADAAGVSRGTVDRVINKRGHVRPEVEKRILQIAKDLHYRPNPYGRALVKSTKTSKIGVICQFGETPFMKLVVEGIEQARKEITARGSEVLIETIDSYDTDRTLTAIDRMLLDGVEGLALTAGPAPELQEKLREVIKSGIPVITFNTDSKESGRLSYVGLENYRAGTVCAGLMGSALRNGGLILPISGYLENYAHSRRMLGFRETIAMQFPSITLLPAELCHDTDAVAEEIVHRALRLNPDIKGIYISGNGQHGVCEALRAEGLAGKICLIVYDLTERNKNELRNGTIDFLIDQNAFEQGYRPAMLLYNLLILGQPPEKEFYFTDIHIMNRFCL